VATFAEVMISEEERELFHSCIVEGLHTKIVELYREIGSFGQAIESQKQLLVSCEPNLWAVLQRMADSGANCSFSLGSHSSSSCSITSESSLISDDSDSDSSRHKQSTQTR
jgi:hypothetical protein